MSKPVPLFTFCGCFDGKGNISAARWLLKLEHELAQYQTNGIIPPDRFIDSINLLLTNDAAEWAETNPDAARLLGEEEPTTESVTTFRNLFQERFPAKTVESSSLDFYTELNELKQRHDESISSYHKRVSALMLRVGAKYRSTSGTLSLLESATLDVIMKSFVRGLYDNEVRKETIRGLIVTGRSLRGLVSLAEDADRSKRELKKLLDEESKTIEFQFYRDIIQQTMPKDKVESMLASYRLGTYDRPATAPPTIPSYPVQMPSVAAAAELYDWSFPPFDPPDVEDIIESSDWRPWAPPVVRPATLPVALPEVATPDLTYTVESASTVSSSGMADVDTCPKPAGTASSERRADTVTLPHRTDSLFALETPRCQINDNPPAILALCCTVNIADVSDTADAGDATDDDTASMASAPGLTDTIDTSTTSSDDIFDTLDDDSSTADSDAGSMTFFCDDDVLEPLGTADIDTLPQLTDKLFAPGTPRRQFTDISDVVDTVSSESTVNTTDETLLLKGAADADAADADTADEGAADAAGTISHESIVNIVDKTLLLGNTVHADMTSVEWAADILSLLADAADTSSFGDTAEEYLLFNKRADEDFLPQPANITDATGGDINVTVPFHDMFAPGTPRRQFAGTTGADILSQPMNMAGVADAGEADEDGADGNLLLEDRADAANMILPEDATDTAYRRERSADTENTMNTVDISDADTLPPVMTTLFAPGTPHCEPATDKTEDTAYTIDTKDADMTSPGGMTEEGLLLEDRADAASMTPREKIADMAGATNAASSENTADMDTLCYWTDNLFAPGTPRRQFDPGGADRRECEPEFGDADSRVLTGDLGGRKIADGVAGQIFDPGGTGRRERKPMFENNKRARGPTIRLVRSFFATCLGLLAVWIRSCRGSSPVSLVCSSEQVLLRGGIMLYPYPFLY
ncbi:hypothetical protein MMC07_003368 [Pseudocyphellaria aurata]|nr:hypothetical protein [Pseudocyphellaria aurata]